jgi:hypothetical protein
MIFKILEKYVPGGLHVTWKSLRAENVDEADAVGSCFRIGSSSR